MSIIQDPCNFNKLYRQAMNDYINDTWLPAVKKDPTEYNYWRMTSQKRMGKFRVVPFEGQQVIQE